MVALCTAGRPADLPADMADLWSRLRSPASYGESLAELDAFQRVDSQQVITARKPFGAMPLIILTATTHPAPGVSADDAVAVERVWSQMHDEVAALSTRGENRVVPGAGHYVHRDRRQLVVDTVLEVVAAARAKAGK
jgi:hypothetical protein